MSLNAQGLGFSFGAKNKGLLQMQKRITKGFGSMTAAQLAAANQSRYLRSGLDDIGRSWKNTDTIARNSRWQTFLQAIGVKELQKLTSSIAKSTGNLTTSFESELLQNKRSAMQTTAAMGVFGKEAQKIAEQAQNIALATGVSFEKASQAVAQFPLADKEFAAIGIKNATDLAKTAELLGFDIAGLRSNLQTSSLVFNGNTDAVKTLGSALFQLGVETKDVNGAMNSMPKILDQLAAKSALMLGNLKPEEKAKKLAEYAQQIAAVASGFFNMPGHQGHGADEALNLAMQIGDALIGAQRSFQKMFAGTEEDLSPFVKELAVIKGDVGAAFKDMDAGPDQFMIGMTRMVQSIKAQKGDVAGALNFMHKRIAAAFGSDEVADKLVAFFSQATDETLKNLSTFGARANKQMGEEVKKNWFDPRTREDMMQQYEKVWLKGFRDLARGAGDSFVKETGAAYAQFGKQVKQLAAADGPLGQLAVGLSKVHQLGSLGFIPAELRPVMTIIGKLAAELGPNLAILSSLGFQFKDLLSPVKLAIGGIVGFAAATLYQQQTSLAANKTYVAQRKELKALRAEQEKYAENSPQWTKLDAKIKGLEATVLSTEQAATRVAASDIGEKLQKWVKSSIKAVETFVKQIPVWWQQIQPAIEAAWKDLIAPLWRGITQGWVGNIDNDAKGVQVVGASMGGFLKQAFDWVGGKLAELWRGLGEGLDWNDTLAPLQGEGAQRIGQVVGVFLNEAWQTTIKPGLIKIINSSFSLLWDVVKTGFSTFWNETGFLTKAAVGGVVMAKVLPGLLTSIQAIATVVGGSWEYFLKPVGKLIWTVTKPLADALSDPRTWDMFREGASKAKDATAALWEKIADSKALESAKGGLGGLREKLSGVGEKAAEVAKEHIGDLKNAFTKISGTLVGKGGLVLAAGAAGYALGTMLRDWIPQIDEYTQKAFDKLGKFFTWLQEKAGGGKSALQKLGVGQQTLNTFSDALKSVQAGTANQKTLDFVRSVATSMEDAANWAQALSDAKLFSKEDAAALIAAAKSGTLKVPTGAPLPAPVVPPPVRTMSSHAPSPAALAPPPVPVPPTTKLTTGAPPKVPVQQTVAAAVPSVKSATGLATGATPDADAKKAKAAPPPVQPAKPASLKDINAALLEATNNPKWYERWEQVFLASMKAQQDATASLVAQATQQATAPQATPAKARRQAKPQEDDAGYGGYLAHGANGAPR